MNRRRRVAALLALLLIAAILTAACLGPKYYIGNTKTKVFHKPTCSYLPTVNRTTLDSRAEAIALGYTPCQHFRPWQRP